RMTGPIEPGPVVESGGVNHERVAVPMSDRVPQPGRVRIVWELPSIHVDLPVASGATLEEHRHDSRRLDDPVHRVDHFRGAARQAVRNGIIAPEVFDAFQEDGLGRWPEDRFVLQILNEIEAVRICFGLPYAGEVRPAI